MDLLLQGFTEAIEQLHISNDGCEVVHCLQWGYWLILNVRVQSIKIQIHVQAFLYECTLQDGYLAFSSYQFPKQSHLRNVVVVWTMVKYIFVLTQPLNCPLRDLSILVPFLQILTSPTPWIILNQKASLYEYAVICCEIDLKVFDQMRQRGHLYALYCCWWLFDLFDEAKALLFQSGEIGR